MFEDIARFFKSLFSSFKNRSKKGNFPVFVVVLCFLILIPTVFAIFFAYFHDDSAYFTANEVKVELFDAQGKLIASDEVTEANIDDSPLVSSFYNMTATKKPASRPESFNDAPNYRFVITHGSSAEEYFCYFTDKETDSFLKSKVGSFFSVTKPAYDSFLNSAYSEAAYPSSVPPQLITGNGECVVPVSFQWHYKKISGRVFSSTLCETTDDIITYKIGGALNLNFQTLPDVCAITISDTSGAEIYSGSLEELAFVTIESGTLLHAKISAAWINEENSSAFGEVNYEFKISLGDRAQFFLNTDQLAPSQFLILSANNVDDISRVIFSLTSDHKSSDFAEGSEQYSALNFIKAFTPTFVRNKDMIMAAIPFPTGTPAGDYELEVAFGAEKQSFKIKITESLPASQTVLEKSFAEISSAISQTSLESFNNTLKSVVPTTQQIILFRDEFISPTENGFSAGYKYGSKVSASDQEAEAFTSLGNEYLSAALGGSPVPALNTGIVVATGYSTHLGNYVAVEHGMGIRTWYCCLSSVDVEVGDGLAKGESLGKCGSKGVISASGCIILCSVYDCLVDPDFIIGKEIK